MSNQEDEGQTVLTAEDIAHLRQGYSAIMDMQELTYSLAFIGPELVQRKEHISIESLGTLYSVSIIPIAQHPIKVG